jgi:hypothetical protein
MARRGHHHHNGGRREGRAEPEGGLGVPAVRRPGQAQADFANRLYYGPTNPEAFKFISPEVARQLPTYSENAKVAIRPDTVWEADNTARIQERFTQWLAA